MGRSTLSLSLQAAHDAGTAIGAALDVARAKTTGLIRHERMRVVPRVQYPFLGLSCRHDRPAIDAAIGRSGLSAEIVSQIPRLPREHRCSRTASSWVGFRVAMSSGPGLWGCRFSLLADLAPSRYPHPSDAQSADQTP